MAKQEFTVADIEAAHNNVKSGSDFPAYIRELINMGITGFETYVFDSHTVYQGEGGFNVRSESQYGALQIAGTTNVSLFKQYLKAHQEGQSDYFTFCRQCAETGIERWIVSMKEKTCTYYDKAGNNILQEQIPVV